MKKVLMFVAIISIFLLTGCGNDDIDSLAENLKKIELTGNLVTYQAYYHNVVEYDKPATGLLSFVEKDRKLFAEYTGTIKYGINLSKVKINVNGSTVNVFIPKATVIGEPNVSKDDFKSENFIESKDGIIFKNPITADDSSSAFNNAQKEIKENAINDIEVLSMAQKRAKVIIEENINQFSGMSNKKYTINWEYEQ